MKKTRFMSVLALTATIGTVTAAPVFAADNTADGSTTVTYTANSASPDQADWLVSYPSNVVLSDYNTTAQKGVSLNFEILDKDSGGAYVGNTKVAISLSGYPEGGIPMDSAGGGSGSANMGIANSGYSDVNGPEFLLGEMGKTAAGTVNEVKGYAYLKSTTEPKGTFNKTVTFTFTGTAN